MSKYLESCNNECKIVMLLLVAVFGFLLYQCYNKPSACVKEGFGTIYYPQKMTQAQINSEKANQERIKTSWSNQAAGQRRAGNTKLANDYQTLYADVAQAKINELNRKIPNK